MTRGWDRTNGLKRVCVVLSGQNKIINPKHHNFHIPLYTGHSVHRMWLPLGQAVEEMNSALEREKQVLNEQLFNAEARNSQSSKSLREAQKRVERVETRASMLESVEQEKSRYR